MSHLGVCGGRSRLEPAAPAEQNTTKDLDRRTQVCELHVVFKISYVFLLHKSIMQDTAELTINHVNPDVRGNEQEEAKRRKCKRLKLCGGQTYDISAD
jgi:sulfatase maturation enzyme AslB (radical SAM superfamily)